MAKMVSLRFAPKRSLQDWTQGCPFWALQVEVKVYCFRVVLFRPIDKKRQTASEAFQKELSLGSKVAGFSVVSFKKIEKEKADWTCMSEHPHPPIHPSRLPKKRWWPARAARL